MLIFGAAFALLGVMYSADGWGSMYAAVVLGAFGLFLGAVYGSWRRKMVDDVYGPAPDEQYSS
jgi:hypothetical protein